MTYLATGLALCLASVLGSMWFAAEQEIDALTQKLEEMAPEPALIEYQRGAISAAAIAAAFPNMTQFPIEEGTRPEILLFADGFNSPDCNFARALEQLGRGEQVTRSFGCIASFAVRAKHNATGSPEPNP